MAVGGLANRIEMQAELLEQAQEWLQQQKPVYLVLLLAALYFAFSTLISVYTFAARWVSVGWGTRSVPVAPGGNWLLGHVFQLASGCAWEKMHDWVRNSPPIVRFRILHRTGIIISDPLDVKRVFQVRFYILILNHFFFFLNCRLPLSFKI